FLVHHLGRCGSQSIQLSRLTDRSGANGSACRCGIAGPLAPPRITAALVDDSCLVTILGTVNVFLYFFPVAISSEITFCSTPLALVAMSERAICSIDHHGMAAVDHASDGLCRYAFRPALRLASRAIALVGHGGRH